MLRGNKVWEFIKKYFLWFLIAAAIAVPFIFQGYWLRVLTSALMFAVLAQAANIIAGYAGCPAIGNILFFGVGAYVTAILMTALKLPFFVALLGCGIFGALYATIWGLPLLRIKGHYFVMATMGLNYLSKELVNNLSITNGSRGIMVPLPNFEFDLLIFFYFMMLAALACIMLVIWKMERSKIGYALKAIKADEEAAKSTGINAASYKTIAWAISAFFTSVAGGIYAYWITFIDPASAFDTVNSTKMFIMYSFGGPGTLWGPVLGALSLEFLSETIWGSFSQLHYLVLGVVMILIIMFIPGGIYPMLKDAPFSWKQYKEKLRKGRL